MAVKRFTVNGEETHVYKNMKGRYSTLAVGLSFCLISFCCMISPLIMLFVPGAQFSNPSLTLLDLAKYLNGIATALGFIGIIMAVAGANTNKTMARFSFLFGIIGFVIGLVMLILSLFFSAILPF